MNRRTFLQAAGTAAVAAAKADETAPRMRYYRMETLLLEFGDQMARVHDFMSQGFLPAARKAHPGPMLFMEAIVAPHMPQYVLLMGFASAEDALEPYSKLHAQDGYSAAVEKWESGPNPPYSQAINSLLETADYSPEIAMTKPAKQPRIFELRTYHSPTWRQLGALHQRFAGREIPIFHRHGIHPLLYTSTVFGNNLPNLTYLIPFDDLATREKAWAGFGSDPEWAAVRKESMAKNGEITPTIQISLFRAAPYSPIR